MSETTTEQLAEIEGQPEPIQVREGRWKTRNGDIRNVTPTPEGDGRSKRWPWWDAHIKQTWHANGRYHLDGESLLDLVEYLGPIETDKTQELPDKTQELPDKTQELPGKTQELPGKTQELPAEYTPPDGWVVLRSGELLQPGDQWVNWEGTVQRPDILHGDGATVSGGRYIRRIAQQPQPEPQATDYTPPEGWRLLEVGEEVDIPGRDQYVIGPNRYIRLIEPEAQPQAEPVQVREGCWKTRDGDIRNVIPTPKEDGRSELWPWWDAAYAQTWRASGQYRFGGEGPLDLVEYLGPIEEEAQPQAEPEPQPQPEPESDAETIGDLKALYVAASKALVDAGKANDRHVDTIGSMQRELQQQHRELQKRALRIFDLDTITTAQEQAVERANKENDRLALQLAVVKEELTTAAAVCVRLQIELDAAQQVPADSPELRQLRSDLAEVTQDRNTYWHAHELLVRDANTAHERTRAMTVEAIIEWLQPFRGCKSPSLALLLIEALPDIMRSLTGLADEEIE